MPGHHKAVKSAATGINVIELTISIFIANNSRLHIRIMYAVSILSNSIFGKSALLARAKGMNPWQIHWKISSMRTAPLR